jgi:hypothetical protein
LSNHVAEDRTNSIETLVCGTDVVKAVVVQKDLLNDEDGYGLAKFRTCLHDAQAERNNLRGQEEVDDFGRVILDERTDNTQARKPEVLERPRFGSGVKKGVEEQRNVCYRL